MKKLLVVLALVVLGCATTTPILHRIPFPENEYVNLPTTGTATVKGQAFLKTRGGDVKTAAGEVVVLNPVTSYSQEWYEKSYLRPIDPWSGRPDSILEQPDKRLSKYVITQIARADGSFIFKDVPAGQYFLTTTVSWEVPTHTNNIFLPSTSIQGGYISKKITVQDGDFLDIILTR